jgi:hypothetical protein
LDGGSQRLIRRVRRRGQKCDFAKGATFDAKRADRRNVARHADNQIHAIAVERFRAIGLGWDRGTDRVRVIETDDIKPAAPSVVERAEVILRIDQKPRRRSIRDVPGADGVDDSTSLADEDAATLVRQRGASVIDNAGEDARVDLVLTRQP